MKIGHQEAVSNSFLMLIGLFSSNLDKNSPTYLIMRATTIKACPNYCAGGWLMASFFCSMVFLMDVVQKLSKSSKH